ncbi:MAG: hypothetical protein OXG37_08700 [Actinomycetia bacterium]|nr:hypothetical protein [Actinomycetes bacterium]
MTTRKTADGGVDGRICFYLLGSQDHASMVIEVKGGKHVTIQALRALRGVLERDEAVLAGLIIM